MRTKSSGPKFSLIYVWEMDTPAYRLMSAYGRALLLEYRRKHNGSNNGEIAMSALDAARLVGCCKNTAFKTQKELVDKGWIRPTQTGSFHLKTDAAGRKYSGHASDEGIHEMEAAKLKHGTIRWDHWYHEMLPNDLPWYH